MPNQYEYRYNPETKEFEHFLVGEVSEFVSGSSSGQEIVDLTGDSAKIEAAEQADTDWWAGSMVPAWNDDLPGPWYGQRKEDKIIASLLKNRFGIIPEEVTRVYVDVGAWDANIDSVTKHFYNLGWRGINIEPVPEFAARISKDRPGDFTLQCGAGERNDEAELFVIPNTGLSTLRQDYGTKMEGSAQFGTGASRIMVDIRTLTDILDEFLPNFIFNPGNIIDFLKIDVEGYEREVLLGLDFEKYHPLVIAVEATVPGTDIPDWERWESIILSNSYRFEHFDGLNRFYTYREPKKEA